MEILDKKRCLVVDGRDTTLALEQEEAVFPACVVPMELYGELISSYSATSVVDLSPGQGEFLKACLAARTKCLAVAHTESHAKHLELICTDFVLSELRREGSTFFRPDAVEKDADEEAEESAVEKTTKKPKKEKKETKEKKESDKKNHKRKTEEEDGVDDDKKPPKKPKQEKKTKEEEKTEKKTKPKQKKTKKEESDVGEEGSETSSAMW